MSAPVVPGNPSDTIFAPASGAGRAAIAIIRISGRNTGSLLKRLAGSLPSPRRATLRDLRNPSGELLDSALILWMPAPASYTGEDSAELHLHGGLAVTRAVTGALLQAGARPADPGEFTRRAFLSGRMSLLEAEALGDLVNADTELQRRLALSSLRGGAVQQIAEWSERLTHCLAYYEAFIDFPDETAGEDADEPVAGQIRALAEEMDVHLRRSDAGERVRNGLVFAITGAPNVGKSSLLNAIAGRDVAIVSPQAGTTRDLLEVHLDLGGVPVTLVDTAGLRDTDNAIEAEGVRRARARAASADLVLHVIGPDDLLDHDGQLPGTLAICNKTDLGPAHGGAVPVSALTGDGITRLFEIMATRAGELVNVDGDPLLSQARHVAALRDARAALVSALDQELPELRAEELRLALLAVGRLAGRVDTEAVLDVVFGRFCIGK